MRPPSAATPADYVTEAYELWAVKSNEIGPHLAKGYKAGAQLFLRTMDDYDKGCIPKLEEYLTVADWIKKSDAAKHEIYEDLESYSTEPLNYREFHVICCPSLTGKTQFAFTLNQRTLYIPLATGQKVYLPFVSLLGLLKRAAFKDLAKCYLGRLHHNETGTVCFDPVISASDISTFLDGKKSYVLGVIKFFHDLIAGSNDAIESTEAVVDFLKNLPSSLKIKPVTFEEFDKSYKGLQTKCFIVFDEFPSKGVNQVIALFVRNILRSREARLIIMSTSASVKNMISTGNTLQTGSGGDLSSGIVKWAILHRRLIASCIESFFVRMKYATPARFWRGIGKAFRTFYFSEESILAFENVLKNQINSSRPGLSYLAIYVTLWIIQKNLREARSSNQKPFNVFFEKFLNILNFRMKKRKGLMFNFPGYVGSVNLAFPNSLIREDLLGPTSSSHINNHLYFLADPLGKDHPLKSFRTVLYSEITIAQSSMVIDENLTDDSDIEMDLDIDYVASILDDDLEMPGPATLHQANMGKASDRSPPDVEVVYGDEYGGPPVYTNESCDEVNAAFKVYSEMPLPEQELFVYLGSWGIGNSFVSGSNHYRTFLSSLHEYLKDCYHDYRIGSQLTQHGTPNDGVFA